MTQNSNKYLLNIINYANDCTYNKIENGQDSEC